MIVKLKEGTSTKGEYARLWKEVYNEFNRQTGESLGVDTNDQEDFEVSWEEWLSEIVPEEYYQKDYKRYGADDLYEYNEESFDPDEFFESPKVKELMDKIHNLEKDFKEEGSDSDTYAEVRWGKIGGSPVIFINDGGLAYIYTK
jgi:hypothetical protein